MSRHSPYQLQSALGRFLWGLSYPEQTEELTGLRGAQVAWQGLDREEQQREGAGPPRPACGH